jgi:UDP-N-acetylglucosamine--N-acetylmuramyl-(pentapeptide) pyrophosphoryl-undecaprenol N-acetylglucosamine transferase
MVWFFSSPIGLGHITRDIAIINKIMQLFNYDNFEIVTGSTAYEFLSDLDNAAFKTNISSHNLYKPPAFSIINGRLRHGFIWILKYLYYYNNCKNSLKKFLYNNNYNSKSKDYDLIISDEDFASLSVTKSYQTKRIFITDILNTNFSKSLISYKLEKNLNKHMLNLIESAECVIIPETGDNKDNFYYVGPIVREINNTKENLRKRFMFDKKTILVSAGGTTAGSYLLKKTIESFLRLKNNYEYNLFILARQDIPLPKLNSNCKFIGLKYNGHEYLYASDLVISLAGKSTIDESKVYGIPGIFIPIKNHFEQEDRARSLGFKFEDINKLDILMEEILSNNNIKKSNKINNGVLKASEIIYHTLNN